ncbi:MAG: F-type H+-transporting ATPase subunit epsilon [Sphingobacteriales bacterium]|jgi:F-type H+-transporting ATPase subunit epsilon
MHLEVLTPDRKVFTGEVIGIRVPGSKGSFEVLNNHAAIVSTLDNGPMIIRKEGETLEMVVEGGTIEVLNNNVVVLAESVIEN